MASTLTSSSTLAEVEAAYVNNASYTEDDSTTKCRAFVTAVRILLLKLPTVQVKGANSLSYSAESLQKEIAEAKAWLLARDPDAQPDASTTRADFRNCR